MMKRRGLALITIATILGTSVPFAHASTSTASTWTVKSGDTLWAISQSTAVPINQIEQANGITNPNLLQVGETLTIPSSDSSASNATSTVSTSTSSTGATYTVKSGDTLWAISEAKGVSISAIEQANNLPNPNQLSIGQVLTIPTAATSSTGNSSVATSESTNTNYTVKSGDTLWAISQRSGVSLQAMEQANNLSDPNQLSIGQVLTIPPTDTGTAISTTSGTIEGTSTSIPSTGANIAASLGQNLIVNDLQDNPLIRVVVTDSNGTPMTNQTVIATSANSSIAQVVGRSTTNNNGVASVSIEPGSARGTTTITLTCDGATQTLPVTTMNPPKTINLSVPTLQIAVDSNTPLPVSIQVLDGAGQPVSGVPILPELNGNASLTVSTNGPIVTNSQGNATFDLVSDGTSTGSSLLSATIPGELVSSGNLAMQVLNASDITPPGPVATVNMSAASSNSIGIGQSMKIDVTARDKNGNQVTVNPSDIQYQVSSNTGTVDPATGEFSATTDGQYTIYASINGVESQNDVTVSVYGIPTGITLGPAGISLGPDTPWEMVNDPSATQTMHIRVIDSTGMGVPNQTVTLTSDNPNVVTTSSQTVTTDAFGDASVLLIPGTTTGTAHITLTVNGNVKATSTVQVSAQPSTITVTPASTTLVANTEQQTIIHVVATNADGSPAAGDAIDFTQSPDLLNGWGADSVEALDNSGSANLTVYPANVNQAMGPVTLTATIGQATGSTVIAIVPGADGTHSTAFVPSDMKLGSSVTLDTTVDDVSGNPVEGLNQAAFTLVLTNGSHLDVLKATTLQTDVNAVYYSYQPQFTPTSQVNFTTGTTVNAQLYVNGVAIGPLQSVTLS